jgi:hypothetical protein
MLSHRQRRGFRDWDRNTGSCWFRGLGVLARVCLPPVGAALATVLPVGCETTTEVALRADSLVVSQPSVVVMVDSTAHITARVVGRDTAIAFFIADSTVARGSGGSITGVTIGTTEVLVAADTLLVHVPVTVVERLAELHPSDYQTCARAVDGRMECWGYPSHGVPYLVGGFRHFRSVTTSAFSACGLGADSAIYCRGSGVLGTGAFYSDTSVRVTDPAGFAQVVSGLYFDCALTTAGQVRCWGEGQKTGVLGRNSFEPTPVNPVPSFTFTMLAAGYDHMCGLTSGGAVFCWGDNYYGETGDTATAASFTPFQVQGLPAVTGIVAQNWHTCGLTSGGDAWCWGDNWLGQLGDTLGTGCQFSRDELTYHGYHYENRCSLTPIKVAGGRQFTTLAAGNNETCALDATGQLWCWGDNSRGQFGNGGTGGSGPGPQAAAGNLRFTSVGGGSDAMCGVATDGRGYCWGADGPSHILGQPGAPDSVRTTPTAVEFQP